MITRETANVYRGGGRRFFTKSAAVHAEAKMLYQKAVKSRDRCECDKGDMQTGPGPYTCPYHDHDTGIWARYIRRYSPLLATAGQQGGDKP